MSMQPILTIKTDSNCFGIYQRDNQLHEHDENIFLSPEMFFVKQNDIGLCLGYTEGNTGLRYDKSIKETDSAGRLCKFIKLLDVTDFLDSLPTTGNRRKNSKLIEKYIDDIIKIFKTSYDPINEIKSRLNAVEPFIRLKEKGKTEEYYQRIIAENNSEIARLNDIIDKYKTYFSVIKHGVELMTETEVENVIS